jgi:hypothetical protein
VSVGLPFVGTYPHDEDFWVDPKDSHAYPLRYGDVFITPDLPQCCNAKGKPWRAVMAVHPSCELGAKSAPDGVQVVRVSLLSNVNEGQRNEIRAGFREKNGQIQLSWAHLVYLATVQADDLKGEDLYADLRATARVPLDSLQGNRIAAMTHDARVALLRRDTYFRYRWPLTLDAVASLERDRIASDTNFHGPRPS